MKKTSGGKTTVGKPSSTLPMTSPFQLTQPIALRLCALLSDGAYRAQYSPRLHMTSRRSSAMKTHS